MNKRLLSLTSALVMLLTLAVGCAGIGTSNPSGGQTSANENTAQLVVAMNPILVYDDGETVIAYNDVKNATKADFEGATLTALQQNTGWSWMYKIPGNWKKRAAYTLDKWTNGSGAKAKSTFAYAYNNEGTTSLASYYAQTTELTAYGDTDSLPDYGLLLSVTGSEEEAITYTVQKDGILNLAPGVFTAVQSVAGVNTGFLAEDGTARSASVRVLLNDLQVFSGTLCNSTASPDGRAVTSLNYEQISDLKVEAGNVILIAVKLNATANKDEDQSAPPYNDEDNWTVVDTEVRVPITDEEGDGATVDTEKPLSILDEYDSRFVLVRHSEMAGDMLAVATQLRADMEAKLDTEVLLRNENHAEQTYEIILGAMKERPDSVKVYNELVNHRANNANDFIIRRMGNKVYVAATNALSLQKAAEHLLTTFYASEKSKIPAGYVYAYRPDAQAAHIAGTPLGNYVIRVEKYPTMMVQRAAEELQQLVRETCGYLLPILPMTDAGKHYDREIQIGPMNGSVKVDRAYDTRFTAATTDTVGKLKVTPTGFITGKADGYYKAAMAGNHLVINGATAYAVNAAVMAVYDAIAKDGGLPKGYSLEGTYRPGAFALSGGYDLVWREDFSYDTTRDEAAVDKEVREYWQISGDTTPGPTIIDRNANNEPIWDQQRRPGLYGENWWIWTDKNTGNGYLVEVTKKERYGYDAGRLIAQNKWAFRYGIWETRIVTGTRNGACSAVWAYSGAPDVNASNINEIDVYENFGQDLVSACYHTWRPTHIQHLHGTDQNVVRPANGEHFWDTFHSIGIEWTAQELTYYWDGKAFDYIDLTEVPSGQVSTTIKFANGVGTQFYSQGYNPEDWMNEAYTAATGKTAEDFFEIQMVDYSYIFQTSNEGKNQKLQSYVKYDRTHPSSENYRGYLSATDGYVSAQLPQ